MKIEAAEDAAIIRTDKKPSKEYIENIIKAALSVDRVVDCKDISAVVIN